MEGVGLASGAKLVHPPGMFMTPSLTLSDKEWRFWPKKGQSSSYGPVLWKSMKEGHEAQCCQKFCLTPIKLMITCQNQAHICQLYSEVLRFEDSEIKRFYHSFANKFYLNFFLKIFGFRKNV